MEVSVLNIKGEDTGRKVVLNDAVFGIEPNDHAIYLDVKQYLAAQRQGTAKSKERSEMSGSSASLVVRKVAAVLVEVISIRLYSLVVPVCSVPSPAITISSLIRR